MRARTKFPELAIRNHKRSQSAQPVESLVALLLRPLLVHGGVRDRQSLGVELLSLPDEVLEQVAIIFRQHQILCVFHHFSHVCHQSLSLGRKLL